MTTTTVNSITFVDSSNGFSVEYEGPFEFIRDGGEFEVAVPINGSGLGVHEETAETLTEREGDFLVARAGAEKKASGKILAADIIEGQLLVRVDDPVYADPSDIDLPDGIRP